MLHQSNSQQFVIRTKRKYTFLNQHNKQERSCAQKSCKRQTLTLFIRKTVHILLTVSRYDDYDVIVGQGTVFLEMYNQFKQQHGEDAHFDAIICPVGGGGLMSGVSTCCKELLGEKCKVYGAEPLNANDAQRSLKSGRLIENEAPPKTICDGLLTNMKEKTWTIIRYA